MCTSAKCCVFKIAGCFLVLSLITALSCTLSIMSCDTVWYDHSLLLFCSTTIYRDLATQLLWHNVSRPNMSLLHPLCLFSEIDSRLSSSTVPSRDFWAYHNLCSFCAVTVVIFRHLHHTFYLHTYLLEHTACPNPVITTYCNLYVFSTVISRHHYLTLLTVLSWTVKYLLLF